MKNNKLKITLSVLILFGIINFSCANKNSNGESVNNTQEESTGSSQNGVNCNDKFIESKGLYNFTELGLACYNNDLVLVKSLINKGACKERCLSDEIFEYDILYTAILFEQVDIVEYLIGIGQDVNKIYDENGYMALSLACSIKDKKRALSITKMLIDAEAQVYGAGDIGGDYIIYPVFCAINSDNIDLVKLLIECGADLTVVDKQGNTAVNLARSNKQIEALIVENLLKKNQQINSFWYGNYELSMDYGAVDELSSMSIYYDVKITKDSCVFSGMGYKTFFTDLCDITGDSNMIQLIYSKNIDGDGFTDHSDIDTIATIFKKEGKFFIKSQIIANEDWEYDTPVLLDKTE